MIKNGMELQWVMQHMHCICQTDFRKIFGSDEMGNHLWHEFEITHGKNAAKFICYLDGINRDLLFKYLAIWISEQWRKHESTRNN